ncbi:MAG TPA: PPC domain-containing protein [Acidimicrobiia bacterium]|nr:PPC domain-containing protein [Acidimicrobiia bacterium]
MSASVTRLRIAVATLALLVVACGDKGGSTTTVGELTTTTNAAITTEAEPLTLGVPYEGAIDATSDPYPANTRYFFVEVPEGASTLVFTLTDLETDLDLYVGYGSIDSVQGLDAGSWEWAGQEFGTAPEYIEIANPEGGVYYIEVFDYDQAGSTFTLMVAVD